MPPIEPGRVGDIEVPHELLEIPPGGLHQEMKVVAHQDVGEDLGLVDVRGAPQQIEKGRAVGIGGKDVLSVITAAGYMVIGILELDSKWPCHTSKCMVLCNYVKDKDLTPVRSHICNSRVWEQVTGQAPPVKPPTSKDYANAGLPWFDYYDEKVTAIGGSSELAGMKSVGKKFNELGLDLPDNEPIKTENIVKLRAGLNKEQVREWRE